MTSRIVIVAGTVAGLAGFAAADSISLNVPSVGVTGGVGPATGTLSFDDTSDGISLTTYQLRLFNVVDATDGTIDNPNNSIDGDLDTFARVGGTSSGSNNDDVAGSLTLGFDEDFTFGRNAKIVFTEFGGEDEPFGVTFELGGTEFFIDSATADSVSWLNETEVNAGGIYRVFEIDLSDSFFDSQLTGPTFDSFRFSDTQSDGGSTGLSPDINFAGVVVPLPGSSLAGAGLLAGLGLVRLVRRKG